jgi:hypothetical protein
MGDLDACAPQIVTNRLSWKFILHVSDDFSRSLTKRAVLPSILMNNFSLLCLVRQPFSFANLFQVAFQYPLQFGNFITWPLRLYIKTLGQAIAFDILLSQKLPRQYIHINHIYILSVFEDPIPPPAGFLKANLLVASNGFKIVPMDR